MITTARVLNVAPLQATVQRQRHNQHHPQSASVSPSSSPQSTDSLIYSENYDWPLSSTVFIAFFFVLEATERSENDRCWGGSVASKLISYRAKYCEDCSKRFRFKLLTFSQRERRCSFERDKVRGKTLSFSREIEREKKYSSLRWTTISQGTDLRGSHQAWSSVWEVPFPQKGMVSTKTDASFYWDKGT